MPDETSLPYRPCVGIALFNARGEVFVGERIDTPGAWQMPQGGIDDGEDIETAAFRELLEEVGTDKATLIRVSGETVRYDIPPEVRARLPWGDKYCGQEQFWVALRFTGEDKDIDLSTFEHPEFSQWAWVTLDNTLDKIVPFKRDVYAQVIDLFKDIA
ncbi:MAG: RNA pyrophosphohydrolase [Micavibrio sp.]|nr:RNA pyrophosphohydrolase [Micavibrio sp.]